jgi:hypothetical protein
MTIYHMETGFPKEGFLMQADEIEGITEQTKGAKAGNKMS